MNSILAVVFAVCMTLSPVLSQFMIPRQTGLPMQYPFLPSLPIPMNGPMWMGQNGLMGFPSNLGMMMPLPQPMWTGFQQWSQPITTWQTSSMNGNNNMSPTTNTNNGATLSSTTGQSSDPWSAFRPFSTGMNTASTANTQMVGNNPMLSSFVPVNGIQSPNYPWNTFSTSSSTFPMIPNKGMNTMNTMNNMNGMNMGNSGFMNTQTSNFGMPQNGGLSSISTNNMNTLNSQTSNFGSNNLNGGFQNNNMNSLNSQTSTFGLSNNGALSNSLNSGNQLSSFGSSQTGSLSGNSGSSNSLMNSVLNTAQNTRLSSGNTNTGLFSTNQWS